MICFQLTLLLNYTREKLYDYGKEQASNIGVWVKGQARNKTPNGLNYDKQQAQNVYFKKSYCQFERLFNLWKVNEGYR